MKTLFPKNKKVWFFNDMISFRYGVDINGLTKIKFRIIEGDFIKFIFVIKGIGFAIGIDLIR